MNKARFKIYLAAGVLLAAILAVPLVKNYFDPGRTSAWKPLNLFNSMEQADHQAGYLVSIMDDTGAVISKAARGVSVGDEIIQPDGRRYQVARVGGNYARAKYMGTDSEFLAYCDMFSQLSVPAAAMPQKGGKVVGIYHSHTDESYVPSDGTEAIPFKGGIYQVGQSLVNKLKNQNVRVSYDQTAHDPHDNNAYYRSRRTATRLMKENPVALLDVHRDGIPDASYYRKNIANEDVAQLRLVVGRQNPNMSANLDFAKRMMAYAKIIPR